MAFKERKECNSMATSRGVAIERNEKEHQLKKVPILLR
jgi:hypothetical protein